MPLYAKSIGATPAQIGIINGSFTFTAALLSIPAGMATDRLGRKIPVIIGLLAIAVSSLLIPICYLPSQMAVVYALFGVGLAAFAPAMLTMVADTVPPEKFGWAYGFYTTAGYLGMAIGPAVGGILAESAGLSGVFIISGGMSTAVTMLALFMLPRCKSRHKSELSAVLGNSFLLLRNHIFQSCLIATIGSCIGFGIFLTFLPLSAVLYGLTLAQVGILFAVQAMTNVICRIPIGIIADRMDRRWIVTFGLFVLALSLGALGQAERFSNMMVWSVSTGIGMSLIYTAIGAMIAEQVPLLQRGLAMGIYHSCLFLGMTAGSTGMGMALKKISYPICYTATGIIVFMTLLWFIFLNTSSLSELKNGDNCTAL